MRLRRPKVVAVSTDLTKVFAGRETILQLRLAVFRQGKAPSEGTQFLQGAVLKFWIQLVEALLHTFPSDIHEKTLGNQPLVKS